SQDQQTIRGTRHRRTSAQLFQMACPTLIRRTFKLGLKKPLMKKRMPYHPRILLVTRALFQQPRQEMVRTTLLMILRQ
ncbi:MAG TPA: hypothetical protein DIT73_07620, partial [Gammaproteobacteria bacterium]|nr:hypothetical protein [Gammaproteobacteria bacterium]